MVITKSMSYPILASLCFSFMNVFIKLSAQTIPEAEIAFFRGLMGTLFLLPLMYKKKSFTGRDQKLLCLRGLLGGMGMLLNFIALAHLNLGDASLLAQLTGVWVLLFSVLFLKERLPQGSLTWLALIGLTVVCMIEPWHFSSYSFYAVLAILGAAFAAAAYTTIRKLSLIGNHDSYEIMVYFMVTGSFIGLLFSYDSFVWPRGEEWLLLFAVGVTSLVAQYFLTGAFIATNAVIAQFMQYIGVFFNACMGFLVFRESLTIPMIGGGIILFWAGVRLAQLKEKAKTNDAS